MTEKGKSYLKLSEKGSLLPLEETLERVPSRKKFVIGIPREKDENERRIALVPNAVDLLVQNGHQVIMEENAGKAAHFSDELYAAAGATITSAADEVWQADVIVKIEAPDEQEQELVRKSQVLFSALMPQSNNGAYFKKMMAKKPVAVAYEWIKDKTGAFPLVRSMSEIIGNASVMIAAEYLSSPKYGKGVMLGGFPGIRPSEVVIIGSGTVAEYAARTAYGMGALVKIFDDSVYKMRDLQNKLDFRISSSVLQPVLLQKALREADVVIAAKHSSNGHPSCFIHEEMVKQMKRGAVIVDVSIDQGGCFETSRPTSHQHPVYQEYGVTHYCVPNIASKVPHTASYSLSNYLAGVLLRMGEAGGIQRFIVQDAPFSHGIYVFYGALTNKHIADTFDLPFRDLNLLTSALF
ncbi:alanine dehydrogenase [Candidatus Sulfidibacterium hydrothermale]|uniref:alanine dehydrogenase n=1 Tax=Candidatus Sulfidibacterium hydrothermale TaxID=2875962 RepID=UPI001F0A0A04|nr:alanine dehydrogenase [Candidatus Sulfidibacterium hydrothermale]UBM61456.1 alanine dehydrogenase [Candidatus Sulfidibacterium hydrothermale]